jgi:bifunctional NMN adenylyltransferase/nudix hydrolase
MQNTTGILIGRFQPLHTGHRELIRQAKSQCTNLVIIVGSANAARSIKNPYTYLEREAEIELFLDHEDLAGVDIVPLNDYKYSNTQWISDVTTIATEQARYWQSKETILFGFAKEGNDYLKWFPQYRFVNLTTPYEICSTDIRTARFKIGGSNFEPEVIEDWNYFQNEKKLFADYPFPETLSFNCADALVECSGHVLLIQRARAPGRGTWALPGGFKNRTETFLDCAVRELQEETNIRVPEKVLRGSYMAQHLFDDPTRGNGIPRVTLCVHFKVQPNVDGSLPRANGADDAMECGWFPIREVMSNMKLFDDHLSIISYMLGVMPPPAHLNPQIS